MKVLIWVPVADAINNRVDPKRYWLDNESHELTPKVQVEITTNEFAKLQDHQVESKTEKSKLEERMFNESQNIKGGDFEKWYKGLSPEEKYAYKTVFGN